MALPMSPVGSISSQRVDFGPLMERLRMQLAQNQFNAQIQEQVASRLQAGELEGLRLGQQESQFGRSLGEQRAGREQQGELARAAQAFNERELEQRGVLGRAGLALQARGQDIGAAEGAAERAARADLQGREISSREGMQDKQIAATREESALDRAQRQDEFTWRKEITSRQLDNEDKRLELESRAADLDNALKAGEIDQQRYRGELLRINVESAAQALAEAKSDVGLSPAQWNEALAAFERGERPSGDIMNAIARSPKAAAALDTFYKAMDAASGRELRTAQIANMGAETEATKARTKLTEAQTEGQVAENDIIKAKTAPELGKGGELGKAEKAAQTELDRKFADGSLGEVGELRQAAYAKLAEVEGDASEPAKKRREKLQRLLALTEGMEDEDDLPGSLAPDTLDGITAAIPYIGWSVLIPRSGYRVANRIRQELGIGDEGELRNLADEYGIEP